MTFSPAIHQITKDNAILLLLHFVVHGFPCLFSYLTFPFFPYYTRERKTGDDDKCKYMHVPYNKIQIPLVLLPSGERKSGEVAVVGLVMVVVTVVDDKGRPPPHHADYGSNSFIYSKMWEYGTCHPTLGSHPLAWLRKNMQFTNLL